MGHPGHEPTTKRLADAVACLNDGAPDDALRHLSDVLRREPKNGAALYLMGVALYARRDFAESEIRLRQALALNPRQPKILLQLAQTQEAAGNWPTAEECWRQMLELAPQSAQAMAGLANLMIRDGRAEKAQTLLTAALAGSQPRAAEDTAVLEHHLGLALKQQQRKDQALVHFDRARTQVAIRAAVETDRAVLLQQMGRFDEAVAAYDIILQADPLNMSAHLQVNTLLQHLGRETELLASYDAAAARAPDALILPVTKGRTLLKLGRTAHAKRVFEEILRRSPDNAAGLAGLGGALEALGEHDAAIALHERNVALNPAAPDILLTCAAARLRWDDPARARELALQAYAVAPMDQTALALLGLAQRALDDPAESILNNYQGLVRVFDLDPPDGYRGMEEFNRELTAYLEGLHTGAQQYINQTLRGGTQTQEGIFFHGHALAERLRPRIDSAIRRYIQELPANAAAPFINRRTGGAAYAASWSSRLNDCGFHVNHIHAQGWISAVYYVGVPGIAADTAAQQGWLKFGEPSTDFGDRFAPRRAIQPRPGRLVLFPSYMWHGTVPFHSAQSRTTIAFDMVPVKS